MDALPEDEGDNPLRPRAFEEYIGQTKVKENLSVFIDAAKIRGEALDHVLLYGPPGLGKTTLAGIIANEMGVNLRITSGPALERVESSYIEELMVLNTIPMPAGYTGGKIKQLDVAPLFAKAINRVYTETSISSLF